MEQKDLERLIREKEGVASAAFPALMRKVYVWMTLALIITGVTAYGVAHSEVLMQKVLESRGFFWGFLLAELGLVWIISRFIGRLSLTTATLLFIVYSALNGATLSVIFMVYSPAVITKVFFITAGTFGAMAAFGYFTKTDLDAFMSEQAQEQLAPAQKLLTEANIPYESSFERGHAPMVIADHAKKQGFDQIVMGTRGLNRVSGLLLGSVATGVLHLVDIPVTLIK